MCSATPTEEKAEKCNKNATYKRKSSIKKPIAKKGTKIATKWQKMQNSPKWKKRQNKCKRMRLYFSRPLLQRAHRWAAFGEGIPLWRPFEFSHFLCSPSRNAKKKTLPANLALADDGFWHFSDYRERREDVNGNVRNTANFC